MAGSIRKRGNKYQVIIELGKDANGKRLRRYFTADNETDAKKILTENEYQLQRNSYILPSTITFEQLLNRFFNNYVVNNCEITTQQSYRKNLDKYIIPQLGKIKLQELTPFHIENYYSYLIKEVHLSPNTVYRHHAIIHKALDYAVRLKLVSTNVSDAVELPKKKAFESRIYTLEELQKLIYYLENSDIKTPVSLAIYLGLRREEIIGLKWSNVDLENRIISIKEVQTIFDKGLITKKPKTSTSNRSLYISDDLFKILVEQKQKQEEYKEQLKSKYFKSDYVCTQNNGKPFRPEQLSKLFSIFLKKYNLPHIRLHDLRHSFASLLYYNNVPINDISKTLGHSDITTTLKIYTHTFDNIQKNTIMTMNNLIKGEKK